MSLIYYRETEVGRYTDTAISNPLSYQGDFNAKSYTQPLVTAGDIQISSRLDKVKSIRLMPKGISERIRSYCRPEPLVPIQVDTFVLKLPPQSKQTFGLSRIEYVYDNTLMKATNIWNGLRYKIYMDFNFQLNNTVGQGEGRNMFNIGFDARHYLPIFRNFIWAVRAAGDMSFGNHKVIYYAGGTDGWLFPKASQTPQPNPEAGYAFQTLAVNLRGFNQNVANGDRDLIFNSEFRLPLFTTLFNKPINNAFLRNFQLIQFFDLGNA